MDPLLLTYQEDMHTVMVVCIVAVVISGLFFFGMILSEIRQITQCTVPIHARCTQERKAMQYNTNHTHRHGAGGAASRATGKRYVHYATLEYEYEGQSYKTVINEEGLPMPGSYEGLDIDILINPKNPVDVRGAHEKTGWGGMIAMGAFCLLFAGVAVWAYFAQR